MIRLFRALAHPTVNLRLEARRVYLRPMHEKDWRSWAELRAQSRAFLEPWEPTWPPDSLSRAMYRRRLDLALEELRQEVGYAFHIFNRGDGQLVGGITMAHVRRGIAQSATLGYWVGLPFARQGLMTEAIGAVSEFAFERLKLHRLEAACLPSNEPSRRVLLKNGFQQEGYAREYLRIAGTWHDHLLFGQLAEDWRRERGRR
ncbi:MAG: GNAT family N-acetyltransferase [Alphaproteobacteria bacterium]